MSGGGRERALQLMKTITSSSCRCPAHSQVFSTGVVRHANQQHPRLAPASVPREYAIEMASSNIRYGAGVTREVGMDLVNLGAKKVCVVTDSNIARLDPLSVTIESLTANKVNYAVFEDVRIEPTDGSFKKAIDFAKKGEFDAYVAVGGGSVIDTCKAANLYASHPDADFLDFVVPPIGKGLPVKGPLKPMIAIPTTSGTGSETTGVAIFDFEPLKAKIGIGNRAIRPLLGLIDPLHTSSMPERVAVNSAFDVLCHALESYTAIPFDQRTPRPGNPLERPAQYQGSNPISDVWSLEALRIFHKYASRSVYNPHDTEARAHMHLASCFAGVGFGNAGVHLCHGLSYPISGMVTEYQCRDYPTDHPIVPHGLSVIMTAPAVFEFTAPMCPERHLRAAELLGADITNAKKVDAGKILADQLRKYMLLMKVENGLRRIGYIPSDIPALVKGTLPQERVTRLAPREQSEEQLASLFEASMQVF